MNKTGATTQHLEDELDGIFTDEERPDSISSEAIGGASADDLPANYFLSYKFIGSFIVSLDYTILGIYLCQFGEGLCACVPIQLPRFHNDCERLDRHRCGSW
jgi:hypothetical protein